MAKALVFDLDDTLYLERDYVRSGFRQVSMQVAKSSGASEHRLFRFLWSGFESGVRGNAFDRMLGEFPELSSKFSVTGLVDMYRHHRPDIRLYEPAVFSDLAASGVPMAVITDGPPVSQTAKIEALGLEDVFDLVVLTDRWGVTYRKPHHRAFETVEDALGLQGEGLVYIADNSQKDFIAPNERGWITVRFRTSGQLWSEVEPADSLATPRYEVDSLAGVRDIELRVR